MMAQLFCRFKRSTPELTTSRLYDERTFYTAFEHDLARCRSEAVIESPFLTRRRIRQLLPTLQKMVTRGVRVTINTRHPAEHEAYMRTEAEESIALLQNVGVEILFTDGHHRKLAIFDRRILYEGSLNILSQSDSCEIMRRIESGQIARQMLQYTKVERFL